MAPIPRFRRRLPAAGEAAALAGVLLLAVLSWHLIHGVTAAVYDQYARFGDPPPSAGQPAADGRSQLGHLGYFWSERAFHYRTALMFAVDGFQDPGDLERDVLQQWPEGVDAWREYTLLMEPVYGRLYRWFGRPDELFVEFLLRWIPLLHVLLFFPLYAIARAVGVRPLGALGAVLAASACRLGFSRLSGSLLLKEDFALLWLLLLLAAHLWAWRRRSRGLLGLVALLVVPLLASWHLSQFLLLGVVLATALAATWDRDRRWSLAMALAWTAGALVAGLTPTLWARGFYFSLPCGFLVAWCLSALLAVVRPAWTASAARRLLGLGLLAALVGGLGAWNRAYFGDYGHVFGLLIQKVLHGLRRPEDPAALPFDVRVFWAPPFGTPTWAELQSKLGWQGPLLAAATLWAAVAAWRPGTPALRRAFLLLAPGFALLYLFAERLGVVFLPVAAATAALGAQSLWRRGCGERPSARRRRGLALALSTVFVAAALLNLGGPLRDGVRLARDRARGLPVRVTTSDEDETAFTADLLRWLAANRPAAPRPDDPRRLGVLGEIGVSPQIPLYAGWPVILNSQFENRLIRERYRRTLTALFAKDPGPLRELLAETRAGLLFINRNWALGTGPGSAAWTAAAAEPLDRRTMIVRLHFAPESLEFLEPVYDDEFYRVFRVVPPGGSRSPAPAWASAHGLWWRPEAFTWQGDVLADPRGDRRRLGEFETRLEELQRRQATLLERSDGRGEGGRPRPDLAQLHEQLLQIRLAQLQSPGGADPGDLGARARQLGQEIGARLAAPAAAGGITLGAALARLADGPGGWRELLADRPAAPAHQAAAGQLLALLGRYDEAADLFDRAAAQHPLTAVRTLRGDLPAGGDPQGDRLRLQAVWWSLAAGRHDRARELAAAALPRFAPGDRARDFLARVAAIPPDGD